MGKGDDAVPVERCSCGKHLMERWCGTYSDAESVHRRDYCVRDADGSLIAGTPVADLAALREKCARLEAALRAWCEHSSTFVVHAPDCREHYDEGCSCDYELVSGLISAALSDAPASQGGPRNYRKEVYDARDAEVVQHMNALACGPTHYAGCACHEARHAQQIADANAAIVRLQKALDRK